jgi:hypothetical protein
VVKIFSSDPMFKFFSSIRQNLLNENKTVKYLKYAVGEVLLIMVGIILALQFQNWNEERLLEQDRRDLINNLRKRKAPVQLFMIYPLPKVIFSWLEWYDLNRSYLLL